MSITFSTPDTQYEKLVPYPDEDPEFEIEVPRAGFVELNMSNVNACDMLRLLGREYDARRSFGSWGAAEQEEILAKLVRMRNMNDKSFEKPTTGEDTNLVMIGRSSEYVFQRTGQMIELIKGALARNVNVNFG